MDNRLVFSQDQRLTQNLSHFQIQSLSILHMGNAELSQLLNKEYMENPFLERNESAAGNWQADVSYPEEQAPEGRDAWKTEVRYQLYGRELDKGQEAHLEAMIDLLDEHGFLAFTDKEMIRLLNVSFPEYKRLKRELAALEPEGLGCASMGDYLLFQAEKTLHPVPDALRELCLSYLPLLGELTYSEIASRLGVPFQQVRRWIGMLEGLKPYPVEAAGEAHSPYLMPDLFVEERDGTLSVRVNDHYSRAYCISEFYRSALRQWEDPAMEAYMEKKLQRAVLLYQAVLRRDQTLQKLGELLLDRQRPFFLGGYLTGLTYKEAGAVMDVHPSTVCRMVSSKYLSCPQGVYPLKYFFTKGVPLLDGTTGEGGGADSSAGGSADGSADGSASGPTGGSACGCRRTMGKTSVQEILAGYIRTEEKAHPLSDQALAERLTREHGLKISKRTVSNYREELGIRSVYERKCP